MDLEDDDFIGKEFPTIKGGVLKVLGGREVVMRIPTLSSIGFVKRDMIPPIL